jgi:hypothetical protein
MKILENQIYALQILRDFNVWIFFEHLFIDHGIELVFLYNT